MKRSRNELQIYNAQLLEYAQKQTKFINKLLNWDLFDKYKISVCVECGEGAILSRDEIKQCNRCEKYTCTTCNCSCWRADTCSREKCLNIAVRLYCIFHKEYPREKRYYCSSLIYQWQYVVEYESLPPWSVFTHADYPFKARQFVIYLLLCLRRIKLKVKDMQKYIVGVVLNEWSAIEMDTWKVCRGLK